MHIAPSRLQLPVDAPKALEVELGCADAQFLFQKARVDSQTSYIGVELREADLSAKRITSVSDSFPNCWGEPT